MHPLIVHEWRWYPISFNHILRYKTMLSRIILWLFHMCEVIIRGFDKDWMRNNARSRFKLDNAKLFLDYYFHINIYEVLNPGLRKSFKVFAVN